MSHIFISYSKKNKPYAQQLKEKLLAEGFNVWIDEVIEPGEDWWRNIRQGIKDCVAFVLIMTPESENSHWVGLELLHALEYRKAIFPLLRAGDANLINSDGWSRIANIQYTDVRQGQLPSTSFYDRLANRGAPRQPRGQDITTPAPPVGEGLRPSPAPPPPPVLPETDKGLQPLVPPDLSTILPPPFEWCFVPAGQVILESGGYVPKGGQTFDVSAFYIAKYPITNAQFEVFVTAKDGYADSQWWEYSDPAQKWRGENTKPKVTTFKGDNLPRTNVTWYESIAFCRWLNARAFPLAHRARGLGGEDITLPAEQQWQRAAQGDDGLTYPWGSDFDPKRCNVNESGIGRTTPVTRYPNGASPYGVFDLAGNVWEWCLTDYDTGMVDISSDTTYRVLRGGSWDLQVRYARGASRYWNFPLNRDDNFGFRVLLVAPI